MRLASASLNEPSKQLEGFIDKMRAAAPFGELDWDNAMWDLTDCPTRAGKRLHKRTREVLWFAEHRPIRSAQAAAFAAPFADFAKAIICARHLRSAQTIGAHRVSVRAERYLYDALRKDGVLDPCSLQHRHFVWAEDAARRREKISSAYRVSQRLEEIAKLVDQHAISNVRVQFRSSIPKSETSVIASKMPTRGRLRHSPTFRHRTTRITTVQR